MPPSPKGEGILAQFWMKFTTRSGSVYELDAANKQVRRLNGTKDPTPRQGKDGQWRIFEDVLGPTVGGNCVFFWPSATTPLLEGSPEGASPSTITSEVVSIED